MSRFQRLLCAPGWAYGYLSIIAIRNEDPAILAYLVLAFYYFLRHR
jgi:hypothetical protein